MYCVCFCFMNMTLPIKWSKCGNIKGFHMHQILSKNIVKYVKILYIPKQIVNNKIGRFFVAAILWQQ